MEKANALEHIGASVARGAASFNEEAKATGNYTVECRDKNGNLKWIEHIKNVVCTEGKNAMLTHTFKGSAYTAAVRMGLIGNTSFTATAAGNVAGSITTVSGSPTNGWNEAASGVAATRATPSFGTASGGSLSLSANASFSIAGTDTIQGVFILIKSAAGVDPTSTVGNTNGAIWSAGTFSGGSKAVGSGDTLTVSYTTSL